MQQARSIADQTREAMRKNLILFLRIAVPIAVIGWLLTAIDPEQAAELRSRPKQWDLLLGGLVLAATATSLTFLRWYLLVRVAGLSLTLRDAFRLSCIGYLANFVSAGNVGGDVFKAVFVAREQPQHRTRAIATIVVDRVIGLYALLLVASLILLLGRVSLQTPALRTIAQITFAATGIGGIFLMLILVPGFTQGRISKWLASLPRVGSVSEKLVSSMRMYRDQSGMLTVTIVISMLVHVLLAVAIWLLACGLFGVVPSIAEHLIIVPLSCLAGAIPLTPAGLGSFEVAMQELYRHIPAAGRAFESGVLVALGYRIATIAIAVGGVIYYWLCPKQASEMQEANGKLATGME